MEKKFVRGSVVVNKGTEEFKSRIVIPVTGDRSKRDGHFSGVCISTYNHRITPIGDFSDTWHLSKFEKLFDSFEEWQIANEKNKPETKGINIMEENTKLPKEVVEEIEIKAQEYARTYSGTKLIKRPYIAGATAYAKKLHEARTLIEKMNERCKGLYHDELANEIKTFLYGE